MTGYQYPAFFTVLLCRHFGGNWLLSVFFRFSLSGRACRPESPLPRFSGMAGLPFSGIALISTHTRISCACTGFQPCDQLSQKLTDGIHLITARCICLSGRLRRHSLVPVDPGRFIPWLLPWFVPWPASAASASGTKSMAAHQRTAIIRPRCLNSFIIQFLLSATGPERAGQPPSSSRPVWYIFESCGRSNTISRLRIIEPAGGHYRICGYPCRKQNAV
jgi:hypothetical protein